VSPRTFPRHARPLAERRAGRPAVERWAARIAERGLARPPADSPALPEHPPTDAQAAPPHDPLLDPLAITERCVIGDQLRMPATYCEILGCEAEFADSAALGEADNRARALAAGWCVDDFGRLVCPACQQRPGVTRPWIPGPEPDTGAGPISAAVPAEIAGPHSAAGPGGAISHGRHRRAAWLHVLAALASGNNGWSAPQPVTGPRPTGPPSNPADRQTGAA